MECCEECFSELPTGSKGDPGVAGADGTSAYVYIAYATDSVGTGFTMTPASVTSSHDHIAFKVSSTVIPSPGVGDFTGLWVPFVGPTGPTGPSGSSIAGTTVSVVNNTGALASISSPSEGSLAFVLYDRSLYKYTSLSWVRQYGNGWTSNPANVVSILGGGVNDTLGSGVFS